jgi:tetratricopeptide (TPR) repeat protein
MRELARLHQNLKEYERARFLFEGLLASAPDDEKKSLYFRLGYICGEMRDIEAQVEYYREAIRLGDTTAGLNLALSLKDSNPVVALEVIDAVLAQVDLCECHALRGSVLKELDRSSEAESAFREGLSRMGAVTALSSYQLSWMRFAAREVNDTELLRLIEEELRRREESKSGGADSSDDSDADADGGALPGWDA